MSNASAPSGSNTSPLRFNRIQDSYASAVGPNLEIKCRELRFSMHHKYIVIPPARFMKSYVPAVGQKRNGRFANILQNIPVAPGRELLMYKPLVKALNSSGFCLGLKFAITSSRGDPSDKSKEAVDIGLYSNARAPMASIGLDGKTQSPHTDWSFVELCVECKASADSQDPFNESNEGNVPTMQERKNTLGQILSYAELMLKRQQRTCIYMVLILGDFCRLVRFDHSGAVATQKFNYKTDGDTLIEFLWRFARWDATTRGHDPSAERIPPSSARGRRLVARALKDKDPSKDEDYVRQMFEDSLDPRWSWWKLRVDDKDGARYFFVGKPNFQAPGVAGRGTRGYVAVDAEDIDGPFYYLKDAWRVVSRAQVDKEGKVLQFLNKKDVRYIPTLECHGDVTVPKEQWTKTNELWDDLHKDEEGVVSKFKKHKHYRIVVKEVGQSMSKFSDGRQLVYALRCCVYAHWEAFEAGVIHRDVSAGNVLLYYDAVKEQWYGLLTDWEMSKNVENQLVEGRQLDRTGTWQFLSAQALDRPAKQIMVEDELESFFHVLLYFAVRHLSHNCKKVADFMYAYFDDYNTAKNGGTGCGILKKSCMKDGYISLGADDDKDPDQPEIVLRFSRPAPSVVPANGAITTTHPLNTIIAEFLSWVKAYYSLLPVEQPVAADSTAPAPGAAEKPAVKNHRKKITFDEEKRPTGPTYNRSAPPAEESPEARQQRETTARLLGTHTSLLDLLMDNLEKEDEWPDNDKTEDQLPEKGYKHGADLQVPSADAAKNGSIHETPTRRGTSQKRTSEHVEQPAEPEKPKRSKSGTRTGTRSSSRLRARRSGSRPRRTSRSGVSPRPPTPKPTNVLYCASCLVSRPFRQSPGPLIFLTPGG